MGGAAQALKRIPRIKFPPRHPKPSDAGAQATTRSVNAPQAFFSRPPSMTPGGKATDQPKRTPLSQEEIEAILLGGTV